MLYLVVQCLGITTASGRQAEVLGDLGDSSEVIFGEPVDIEQSRFNKVRS